MDAAENDDIIKESNKSIHQIYLKTTVIYTISGRIFN